MTPGSIFKRRLSMVQSPVSAPKKKKKVSTMSVNFRRMKI
jgi:hypothetical protein